MLTTSFSYLSFVKYQSCGFYFHQINFSEKVQFCEDFTGGSAGKESACNVGDLGSIPGLGRSFGEGNGNPLQYSCLENPVDIGAWWAAVHGVTQSRTQLKQLSMHACIGEGKGNPLQYFCLENPIDRGVWQPTTHGVVRVGQELATKPPAPYLKLKQHCKSTILQ